MNKFLLLGLWPIAASTTLLVAILLFFMLPLNPSPKVLGAKAPQKDVELHSSYQLYNAIPVSENTIEERVTINDARVEIIRQFLQRYESPLVPHAKHLVDMADKYNLDFRLLPAVAMQESGLCKKIPSDSYNCWGYGIYGDKVLRFVSYEEAIETVAKGLSSNYIYDGLTTPEQIMSRYTPSSNGSWASAVRLFMEKME